MRVTASTSTETSGRVRLGSVFDLAVQSSTWADTIYTVSRLADGSWVCECPGFMHGARMDRLCKHIDYGMTEYARRMSLAGILR